MTSQETVQEPTPSTARAQPEPAAPPRPSVLVLRDAAALESYRQRWERLAREALDPNIFAEPWFLLPALRRFPPARPLEIAVVLAPDGAMLGLFPFEYEPRYRRMPLPTLRLWDHEYSFLNTPLVHREHAHACLHALLDWARDRSGAALIELPSVSGDGPFAHALVDVLDERNEPCAVLQRQTRALCVPRADADAYLAAALDGPARRKLRGKEKRLGEQGVVAFRAFTPGDDPVAWARAFLTVEASGWKGRERSAMAAAGDAAFFEEVVREAAERSQLMMLALTVDGRPVAVKCNLLAPPGAFAFKIAYDEAYAQCSPGMLLELENLRQVHARPELRWMDSCASPSSRMFRELWTERRVVETLLLPAGGDAGRLLVSATPLLRWARGRAFRLWRRG